MPRRESRLLEKLQCKNEVGQVFMVEIWQEFVETASLGREPDWLPGLKMAVLDDGRVVNVEKDREVFRIVSTGEQLVAI